MSVNLSGESNKQVEICNSKNYVDAAQPCDITDDTRRDVKEPADRLQYSNTEEVESWWSGQHGIPLHTQTNGANLLEVCI